MSKAERRYSSPRRDVSGSCADRPSSPSAQPCTSARPPQTSSRCLRQRPPRSRSPSGPFQRSHRRSSEAGSDGRARRHTARLPDSSRRNAAAGRGALDLSGRLTKWCVHSTHGVASHPHGGSRGHGSSAVCSCPARVLKRAARYRGTAKPSSTACRS